MQDEPKQGGESPDPAAKPATPEATGDDQQTPATCDHNWRRCPFYCPACDTTFMIRDEPVAWRRRVFAIEGDEDARIKAETKEGGPGALRRGEVLTELAGWSEGEDPPSWP